MKQKHNGLFYSFGKSFYKITNVCIKMKVWKNTTLHSTSFVHASDVQYEFIFTITLVTTTGHLILYVEIKKNL